MKRWTAWILALSLILCAAVLPAAAEEEETQTDAVTSASVNQGGKDGRKNMPGGQTQNGQQPGGRTRDRKNQQPGSAQMPQVPAGVPGNALPPAMPGGTAGETVTPPEVPDETSGETVTPPEVPDGTTESGQQEQDTDSASTPSSGKTTKDNSRNNPRTGKKGKAADTASVPQITFELLLEKGVISQEVYDAIMKFIREYTAETLPAVPAAPAEGANT